MKIKVKELKKIISETAQELDADLEPSQSANARIIDMAEELKFALEQREAIGTSRALQMYSPYINALEKLIGVLSKA